MKKQLYIHIGTGKTGTTALQEFFVINDKLLEEKFALKYISNYRIDNAHHGLCINGFKGEKNLINFRLNDLHKEILKSDYKYFLISSENFPGVSEEEIKDIYYKILSKDIDIHVIVYLRRQDEYLESWYAQVVKADTKNINLNIHNLYKDLNKSKILNFYYLIEKWNKIISKDNIHVKVYEKQQFYKGNIFNDFMRIFKIEDLEEFEFPKKDPNPSLTRDQILLIRAFVNAGLENFLDNVIKKPFSFKSNSSKYFLSPKERTELVLEYENINKQVAQKYLNRKDGKLFYNPLPLEVEENWEDIKQPSIEYTLRALTHIIAKQKIHFAKELELIKADIAQIKDNR